jgi:hypothetical protein
MDIVLFNKTFTSICEKNLIGIFFAGNIENITPIPVMIKNGNNFTIVRENELTVPSDAIFIQGESTVKKTYICIKNNIYATFDQYDIIEGIIIFYTAANIYPKDLIIKKNNQPYHLSLLLKKHDLSISPFFLPKTVRINIDGQLYDFTSLSDYWDKEEIFDLISSFMACTALKSKDGILYPL